MGRLEELVSLSTCLANERKAARKPPRCYFFFFAAFFFAGAFFFALPFFAAIPYPPHLETALWLVSGLSQARTASSTTSTAAEYRGAFVQESRADRRFGKIFLKYPLAGTVQIADQNVVTRSYASF